MDYKDFDKLVNFVKDSADVMSMQQYKELRVHLRNCKERIQMLRFCSFKSNELDVFDINYNASEENDTVIMEDIF